jgi:hypothetical protein
VTGVDGDETISSVDDGGDGDAGDGDAGDGDGSDPCQIMSEHLLISELATAPGEAEFLELWNPGTGAIDISEVYVSDNGSAYFGLAEGQAWMPPGTAGTDFLFGFPAGTTLPADGYLSVELGTDFEGSHGICPDLTVREGVECGGGPVPRVEVPNGGGVGTNLGSLLTNADEMVVVFCLSGEGQVYDIDYVRWGDDPTDLTSFVDKSAVPGYLADTPIAMQSAAPTAAADGSIGRCDAQEDAETVSGGNGATGHDETSEDFAASFASFGSPSPGAANTCP